MDRYLRISLLASVIALGTGVVIANASRVYLTPLKLSTWGQAPIDLFMIAVSGVVTRTLLESWLFLAPPIRKLLLGDQYIEGTWIDLVRRENEVINVGIVQIRAKESWLRYSGENYDLQGRHVGRFESDLASMSWPTLKFKYTTFDITTGSNAPGPFVQGFGEISFDETRLPAIRYYGDCIDSLMGVRLSLEGWKILRKDDLDALVNPAERGSAVVAIAQRHFAHELRSHS